MGKSFAYGAIWIGAAALTAAPLVAQMQAVDPNTVIDADLGPAPATAPPAPAAGETVYYGDTAPPAPAPVAPAEPASAPIGSAPAAPAPIAPAPGSDKATTYRQDDLIGAAESTLGKGAKGLAQLIEKILRDQGEPTAYISGREAGAALVAGLRYGSGTLFHKIEGQKPVYWTGPSVGFDAGLNAASTFVLVYNLHDAQELYQRFPAGEGNAYFVGGVTASYMRSGDIVLIPIRLGAGVRLGANVGYMKFTNKSRWLPF